MLFVGILGRGSSRGITLYRSSLPIKGISVLEQGDRR